MSHYKREYMVNQNNILPRVLPFTIYILFLALTDYLTPVSISLSIDVKWLYTVRVVLVLTTLLYFWRNYIELEVKPVAKDLAYALLAGIFVFLVWILPYPAWAGFNNNLNSLNPVLDRDTLWLSSRFIGAAFIVPVMEEIFWRSLVMRWIDNKNFINFSPKNVSFLSMIVSSAVFASAHHLWLAGLIAGIVYGALYIKCNNLWIPIVAHAVTNGVLGIWVMSTGNWQYW